MDFNFPRSNSKMEHDPVYHPLYFNHISFSNQSIREGLLSGGYGGVGSVVDMREAIQRQVDKEMIREEILAEEAARRRLLEVEVRRELMLETHNGGGFHSSFMLRLDPVKPFHAGSGRQIGDLEAVSSHRPSNWGFDGELKVIHLDGSANRKPPPPVAAGGSSELKHCSGGGEIGLGVASKKSVKKQPPLMKNSSKYVPIDTKTEDKKSELSFRCTMCDVEASSEIVMNQHKEGKKHMKNLEKLNQESGGHGTHLGVRKRSKPKKTKRKQKSHKAARHQ